MEYKERSILVVGAGAVGGIVAAFLGRAGYNVELVCKYEEYRDLVSGKGLRIGGVVKAFTSRVGSYALLEEVKGVRDLVILAVKATDLEAVAWKIKPMLHDQSVVIAMQNGISEYELGRILGKGRIMSCIVGFGATFREPAVMDMTSKGDLVIGYLEGGPEERLKEVAEILSVIAPVRISSNMIGDRYSKLIINSCITSLGALSGLYLGEMLRKRKARVLFIEIMKEAMEVAYIMKIKVEKFGEKLDYYDFLGGKGLSDRMKRHFTIRFIGMKYRRLKSSSLQSLEKGRNTEIDFLNGFIATNGREFGVPVPVNSAVVKMVHEIEQGKRKITPMNFNDELFEKYYR